MCFGLSFYNPFDIVLGHLSCTGLAPCHPPSAHARAPTCAPCAMRHALPSFCTRWMLMCVRAPRCRDRSTSDRPSPSSRTMRACMYGNFDILLDHLSGMSRLFTTQLTPCTVLYLVAMLIGC